MTSATSPGPRRTTRLHWLLDLLLTGLLLAADAVAVVVVVYAAAVAAWIDSTDSGSPETRGPGPEIWALIGSGAVALFAALSAFGLLRRRRAPIAGAVQALAATVLTLGTLTGAVLEYRAAHPAPAPAPDRTGPGHQCLSGGDSDECRDSGG